MYNKLGSRSYSYIHPKNSHICVIHLVLEKCCFEAVLPKRRLDPLGVKYLQYYQPVSIVNVSQERVPGSKREYCVFPRALKCTLKLL